MLTRTIPLLVSLLALPVVAAAQVVPIPLHKEAYVLDSGVHQGDATRTVMVFRTVARVSGAPWLQLHFDAYNLGAKSSVTVTSLEDGDRQQLDSRSLRDWHHSTAYFNGDAVEIALHVAPGERDIFIRMREITVGEVPTPGFRPETICGPTDERVGSADPRVGRIVPVGCTGWIVSNGAMLTAGHCTGPTMQTLQFNVPPSLPNGAIQNPPAADQYPINAASVVFASNGTGDDWAVFGTTRSAALGARKLPVEAQQAFFRMSRDSNPTAIRVTGYGLDGPGPPGPGQPPCATCDFGNVGPRDATSQTQQTHTGPSLGETVNSATNVQWGYGVDTQPANSGSPIIIDGTTLTVGIHTDGGCTAASTNGNRGTGFKHNGLRDAIAAFVGPNARYVDKGFVAVEPEDGTFYRPFDTVAEGVAAVPAGGIVSIVTGAYPETITVTRRMTLSAPVGPVTIGP